MQKIPKENIVDEKLSARNAFIIGKYEKYRTKYFKTKKIKRI